MSKVLRANILSVQTSLAIPMLLFSWFAWQGISRMMVDTAFGWKWYANLIGTISALVIVVAAGYGIYLNRAKKIRFNSKS